MKVLVKEDGTEQAREFIVDNMGGLLTATRLFFKCDGHLCNARDQIVFSTTYPLTEDEVLTWHSAAAAAQPGAAPQEPAYKKLKIDARASLMTPDYVQKKSLIPSAGHERPGVCYYTGRNCSVPYNVASPVVLQAPEFGVIVDTAYNTPGGCVAQPTERHYQAAFELCDKMALVYTEERQRQDAFLLWHHFWFPSCPPVIVPCTSSATGANDGEATITVGSKKYIVTMVEVKNEMGSGEPLFQLLRYCQKAYEDGTRWDVDAVLRATGGALLGVDLVGPNLLVYGVFTVEGNVMAAEPLTPRLPLLVLGGRQEQHIQQLARVLAGYEAAAQLLYQRYQVMASGPNHAVRRPAELAPTVLPGMALEGLGPLMDALSSATLEGEVQAGAASRGAVLGRLNRQQQEDGTHEWARLPYPLAERTQYLTVEPLPGFERRPLFKCTMQGCSGSVLVKFTPREYPAQVHEALASLGLTAKLIRSQRLPGGWWMVHQEFLDEGWTAFSNLTHTEQERALPAVRAAVAAMQAATTGTGGKYVHGDVRAPNIMYHALSGRVLLVDLDWAGIEGTVRYPARIARGAGIPWHPDAAPGKLIMQAHDLHMLQQLMPQPAQQ